MLFTIASMHQGFEHMAWTSLGYERCVETARRKSKNEDVQKANLHASNPLHSSPVIVAGVVVVVIVLLITKPRAYLLYLGLFWFPSSLTDRNMFAVGSVRPSSCNLVTGPGHFFLLLLPLRRYFQKPAFSPGYFVVF